jgi:DNA polymerase-3 subunit gamma/tau
VLSLVVRSGGGSVRDSLSLLDQLIAGSEGGKVEYDRAAALLGFTHAALLDEVVDAFAAKNSAQVFASVDKVIQTGQDPRRFVEDLLEHLRDLIVILSVGDDAKSVLRGIPESEIEKMKNQAMGFGLAELTHAAETVNTALTDMSGATSPKLHLELMCAKVLVPSSNQTEVGSLARLDRLERRIGVGGSATSAPTPPVASSVVSPAAAPVSTSKPAAAPTADRVTQVSAPAGIGGISFTQFRNSWPDILSLVNKKSKAAWMVAFTLSVVDYTDDVLTLKFQSQKDLDSFKNSGDASEVLRSAIMEVFGVQVKFKAHIESKAEEAVPEKVAPKKDLPKATPVEEAAPTTPIAVVEETKSRNSSMIDDEARYGESLLREVLGAEPIADKNGK